MLALLLFAAVGCAFALPDDDLVPTTIEALLAQPDDALEYGIPDALEADVLLDLRNAGTVRSLIDIGDVTGDGKADFAAGSLAGSAAQSLHVYDGASGARLWSLAPDGGGFRGPASLDARNGRLLYGASSAHGLVGCRDAATGALLWSRRLLATPPGGSVNIHAVRFVDDLDGDGTDDVLVAAGAGVDGVALLSGAHGTPLWFHPVGDVVYDAISTFDRDGDGRDDLLIVGGDDLPMARMLSAIDGHTLWQAPLDGPGAVAMMLEDLDGDGLPELAVGQWNAPDACLLALHGADGSRRWAAGDVRHDVTSLAHIDDLQQTGFHDIAVGSFDNAVAGVLSVNGGLEWRREGSVYNTGAMLSVVFLGDLDQSGLGEVFTSSMDHRAYMLGGDLGQYMARHDLGVRNSVVSALADQDGDGRPEILVGGNGRVVLLDGASGLADGPALFVRASPTLAGEGGMRLWAYPTTQIAIFVALGTGSLQLPGWHNPLLLDPATLTQVYEGPAPGSGATGVVIPPLPASLAGITLHFQGSELFGPGNGWFSDLASVTVAVQ